MIKKIITAIICLLLLSLTCYEIYMLTNKNKEIMSLNNKLDENKEVSSEYISLYEELIKELGNFDNIQYEINLLNRQSDDNSELLELLEDDLARLKEENNSLEKQINYLQKKKEEAKNTVIIDKLITYSQFPNYPTGCESVALYILLKYNGIDTSVDEIINKLPKGDLPYKVGNEIYGGNPELEFIGNPRNNYSFGVYNKPLKKVADSLKEGIISKVGLEFDDMLKIVSEKRPVLAWTTINLSKPYISTSWTYKPTGEKIKWISGEHAVVVIGYNDSQIIVSDPYTGTIRYFDRQLFKSRYDYLGKRVLYY